MPLSSAAFWHLLSAITWSGNWVTSSGLQSPLLSPVCLSLSLLSINILREALFNIHSLFFLVILSLFFCVSIFLLWHLYMFFLHLIFFSLICHFRLSRCKLTSFSLWCKIYAFYPHSAKPSAASILHRIKQTTKCLKWSMAQHSIREVPRH